MGLKRKAKTYSCGQILGNFLCIHKIVTTVCSKTPHPLTKNLSASNNAIHVTNETLTLKLCHLTYTHWFAVCWGSNSLLIVWRQFGHSCHFLCWFICTYLLRNTLGEDFCSLQFCSSLRVVLGVPWTWSTPCEIFPVSSHLRLGSSETAHLVKCLSPGNMKSSVF